jgi:hypothetical protein
MGRARVIAQNSFTQSWLLDNIDSMLALSGRVKNSPDFADFHAAEKILALAEHQLERAKR